MPYGPASDAVEDALFGEIRVRSYLGTGRVEVEGPAVPPVTVHRAPGAERGGRVAIGVRRAGRLAVTVDGEPASVSPGRGPRRRAVRVTHRGSRYRLKPRRLRRGRSLLTRDGHRLGHFRSDGRRAPAEWSGGASVSARDAAVGYALAAAFGRWEEPWWSKAFDRAGDLLDAVFSG
ncbi:hypothetical protein [Streptomyces macrosporus]|uniref:Uncharacterized protein n=1 Tax=Streptomyces macrosporus TaxID=44032 RepID=A0ABN3JEB7_9ACTN